MNGVVRQVADRVPHRCHAQNCNKHGCKLRLDDVSPERVLIDMDCKELRIPSNRKRCDYVFVWEVDNTTYLVPIELKSGRVDSASTVIDQLQGGVHVASNWLPENISFQLIPVLAHRKKPHRNVRRKLRSGEISFRGKKKRIFLLRCGDKLSKALMSNYTDSSS